MSWNDLNGNHDPARAKKESENKKQAQSDLAKSYHRVFTTEDGQRILSDLTRRFVYENDTPFSSSNVDYEAAYHNGEAGSVKFIINQMKLAEIL